MTRIFFDTRFVIYLVEDEGTRGARRSSDLA